MKYTLISLNKSEVLYEETDFICHVCTRIKKNGELVMTPLYLLTEEMLFKSPSLSAVICESSLKKTTRQNILNKLKIYKQQKIYVLFEQEKNKFVGWIQDKTKTEYIVHIEHSNTTNILSQTILVPKDLCCLIPSSHIKQCIENL